MGGKESKESEVNSSGQVNNNIIVQEHVDAMKDSRNLLYILVALQLFQILYVLYKDHRRGMKKSISRENRTEDK